jgi:poly(3-hydroxyoctanoate) depolymerase
VTALEAHRPTDGASPTDESFVRVGTLRLRISRRGHGAPLLLIGGLGNNLALWQRLTEELPDVETIAVDGPGMGRSSTPLRPLSMFELADVYACLIKALGLKRASVLGLSFGGAVAQQLAYQASSLVDRLILCGTGPGLGGVLGSPAVLSELSMPWRYYAASRFRRVAPLIYGGRIAREPEAFEGHLAERLQLPPSVLGYYYQLAALTGWSSMAWLPSIAAKTLVLAGDADPVYPVENAHMLGRMIPDARIEVLKNAGHMFVVDSAAEIAPLISKFLEN